MNLQERIVCYGSGCLFMWTLIVGVSVLAAWIQSFWDEESLWRGWKDAFLCFGMIYGAVILFAFLACVSEMPINKYDHP